MKGLSFGGEDGDAPVYRYGKVLYFFQHVSESANGTSSNEVSYTFAMCLWLIEEPDLAYNGTIEQWDMATIHHSFRPLSKFSILPVHCLYSPLITAPHTGLDPSIGNKLVFTSAVKKITF